MDLSAPLDRRSGTALALAFAGGLAGALPRADGAADPIALLAWLALAAGAAGYACGASGARLLPLGLAVPAGWMLVLVRLDLGAARDVSSPLGTGLVCLGLFGAGLGLGGRLPGSGDARAALRGAGLLLLAGLVLAGVGVGGGWGAAGPAWGSARVADLLLAASPVGLVLDCAGWDWTHASPLVYRLSAVEWIPHRPWDPRLAGPVAGVVGCLLAAVLPRRTPTG